MWYMRNLLRDENLRTIIHTFHATYCHMLIHSTVYTSSFPLTITGSLHSPFCFLLLLPPFSYSPSVGQARVRSGAREDDLNFTPLHARDGAHRFFCLSCIASMSPACLLQSSVGGTEARKRPNSPYTGAIRCGCSVATSLFVGSL